MVHYVLVVLGWLSLSKPRCVLVHSLHGNLYWLFLLAHSLHYYDLLYSLNSMHSHYSLSIRFKLSHNSFELSILMKNWSFRILILCWRSLRFECVDDQVELWKRGMSTYVHDFCFGIVGWFLSCLASSFGPCAYLTLHQQFPIWTPSIIIQTPSKTFPHFAH